MRCESLMQMLQKEMNLCRSRRRGSLLWILREGTDPCRSRGRSRSRSRRMSRTRSSGKNLIAEFPPGPNYSRVTQQTWRY